MSQNQTFYLRLRFLEAIRVDYIDESEVISPADDRFHVDKKIWSSLLSVELRIWEKPYVRIAEEELLWFIMRGRVRDIDQAVRHMRMMDQEILRLLREDRLYVAAKELQVL